MADQQLPNNLRKRTLDNTPSWLTEKKDETDPQRDPLEEKLDLLSSETLPTEEGTFTSPHGETSTCACHHCVENPLLTMDGVAGEGHRCPRPPAERSDPQTRERVAENCDGIVPVRPQLTEDVTQSMIATLSEREDTYSRSERANDEIDDSKVDTFAPFCRNPHRQTKYPTSSIRSQSRGMRNYN